MEHKAVNFIIQGMQRDLNVARYDQNFSYENLNVRLTAMDDKTLLAITNERGNKKILIKDSSNNNFSIIGNYVGHCIVGKYLVLFTVKDKSYIYKFKFINDDIVGDLIFSGNLNFKEENPIEALGVYETENVQKVYWVDGINPVRYINIVSDKYKNLQSSNITIFDFLGEIPFPTKFTVSKIDASGEFASGVIQYAYSFYDNNGRESNLVDASSLFFITNDNRGADAETICNNAFSIKIEGINNINYKYDYIRIYSIHRTSLNGTPVTKVVSDIKLDNNTDNQKVSIVDTGTIGYNIDPYELLYKGGESIIPKTLVAKDNTLFLGNFISESNKVDDSLKAFLKEECKISFTTTEKNLLNNDSSYYNYKFQLDKGLNDFSTFKQGETYRFGIQLQDKRGKWSEVIYLEDKEVPYILSNYGESALIPTPYIQISSSIVNNSLIKNNYVKIRGTIVYPEYNDRSIVAQGILCPTVFNLNNRVTGGAYSQSSWFVRPFAPETMSDEEGNITNNSKEILKGSTLEFRHEYVIPVDNGTRNIEIGVSPTMKAEDTPLNPWGESASKYKLESSLYYVDQSILTFHSPEFIFSEDYNNISNQDLKLRIVGYVPLTAFVSDISISTESAGFYNEEILDYFNIGVKNASRYGYKSLSSGLFYVDAAYDKDNSQGTSRFNYLINPWHRNGSLNNSPKVSADKARTAVLKRKVMSNLKFSNNSIYLENPWEAYIVGDGNRTGITNVSIFNSNEQSVVKLNAPLNSELDNITYLGNIDTIATGYNKIYVGRDFDDFESNLWLYEGSDLVDAEGNKIMSKDPVSIKYKSTPHAVFALNYTSGGRQRTLPLFNGLNGTSRYEMPIWFEDISSTSYILELVSPDNSKTYTNIAYWNDIPSYDKQGAEPSFGDIMYNANERQFYRFKELLEDEIEWKPMSVSVGDRFKFRSEVGSYYYYEYKVNYSGNYNIHNESIKINSEYGGLYLAELYKDVENRFGGNDLENNLWLPAGQSEFISNLENNILKYTEGDTFYQRFDCLKTYSYTNEDQNSIVEIVSFMCETRINIDGRYDRNRGQINNLNMSPTNFNLYNEVYKQRNNFFNYRILTNDFNNTYFPTTITWSLNKTLGEKIDSWTKINLASLLDLDGNNGALQKLQVLNNEIYSFQDKAIAKILFNSRVQIPTSEGVPIEIANSGKVDGKVYLTQEIGTINKWSVLTTPNGTYFVDNNNFGIYLLGDGIKCISDMLNMSSLIKEYSSTKEWNPKDASNFRCFYDRINSDVYFVNKYICICYNELLGQFTSYYSYEDTPMMINIDNRFISYKNNYLWEFFKGDYNSFYDEIKPFYITWIANPEPMKDKVFNNLDFRSDTYSNDTLLNRTFDTIEVWNEYQRGKSKLSHIIGKPSSIKRKFRIWRAQIPRHNNTLQRIRNPWCYIKLSMENPSNYKTIFYDATLTYSV